MFGSSSSTEALMAQKNLAGVPKETGNIISKSGAEWSNMMNGKPYSLDAFYTALCEDIRRERARVGGDWVVTQAVPTRALRDLIRDTLGPDLVFVVLVLDKDHQRERLSTRKQFGEDIIEAWASMEYETAAEDEENVVDIKITREMNPSDVAWKIINQIE